MKHIILTPLLLTLIYSMGCSQTSTQNAQLQKKTTMQVGGPCEGCEAIYENLVPFEKLSFMDTLPDFHEHGPKIEVSGIVYQADGRVPAKDVVLYIYHTDQTGHYPIRGNEKGWGKRHGYLRGWMKTDHEGRYKFYTLRPAAYPNRRDPQHIHIIIKEPDKNEYYIDDFMFDDDPLLQKSDRDRKPRGSSGILELKFKNGIFMATRHIILGLNVTDYPSATLDKSLKSGLTPGSNCPAFDPLHLSGADAGKSACPMCKYGYAQGIMVWFNHANLDQMNEFVKVLEKEMLERGEKKLRVFMVYMNPFYEQNDETGEKILQKKIKEWCDKQNLKKVAMVWIPSPVDKETSQLYQINPDAKNTVFLYKKRKVAEKWVNISYDDSTLKTILSKLNS